MLIMVPASPTLASIYIREHLKETVPWYYRQLMSLLSSNLQLHNICATRHERVIANMFGH